METAQGGVATFPMTEAASSPCPTGSKVSQFTGNGEGGNGEEGGALASDAADVGWGGGQSADAWVTA